MASLWLDLPRVAGFGARKHPPPPCRAPWTIAASTSRASSERTWNAGRSHPTAPSFHHYNGIWWGWYKWNQYIFQRFHGIIQYISWTSWTSWNLVMYMLWFNDDDTCHGHICHALEIWGDDEMPSSKFDVFVFTKWEILHSTKAISMGNMIMNH